MEFKDRIKYNKADNEYYKVYDKTGRYIRDIKIEDEKNLEDEYLYGVTCFVINEKNQVLMEERANTELTPGKIDLVSGHVNGNESGFEAILRELREEVGIYNVDYNQIGKLSVLSKPLGFESKGKIRNFLIDFYCVFIEQKQVTKIQQEEVKSYEWVPMDIAISKIVNGLTKFPKQEKGKVDYKQVIKRLEEICLKRNVQKNQQNLQEKKVMEK